MARNHGTRADEKLNEAQVLIMNAFDLIQESYNEDDIEKYHKAYLDTIANAQGHLIKANALLIHRLYRKGV